MKPVPAWKYKLMVNSFILKEQKDLISSESLHIAEHETSPSIVCKDEVQSWCLCPTWH